MFLEALMFFSFLLLCWLYQNRLPPDYPVTPPFRFPFVGHIIYLYMFSGTVTDRTRALYTKYSKDGLLAFDMGGDDKAVMIGDYKMIKEALKREETNYRFPFEKDYLVQIRQRRMPQYASGDEGIINNRGRNWQEQRKFTMSTLRDFGFGTSSMGDLINEEFDHFCAYLTKKANENNGILTIQHFFNIAVLNVLWKVISGERFDYDDPQLNDLIEKVFKIMCLPGKDHIKRRLPILKSIYKIFELMQSKKEKKVDNTRSIRNFMEESIKKHREDFDPANIRDFIDSYLLVIQQTQDSSSSFFGKQGNEQLVNVLGDLFMAGSETTSSTLSFGSLFMVRNPHVQKKVRAEINEVIDIDRSPNLSDLQQMPYTEATIMEIQRLSDIAPCAIPHATLDKELKLGSYTIPSGHKIFPLLSVVLKSEKNWNEPLEFRPERHLDKNGQVIRSELLIPFSIGKRRCPGESLAKAQLFLFFTRLIQSFELAPEDANNLPPTEASTGITSVPKPYKIKLTSLL